MTKKEAIEKLQKVLDEVFQAGFTVVVNDEELFCPVVKDDGEEDILIY